MTQLFVLVALLFAAPEAGQPSRLRITDAKTAALIQRGLERSITFRGLVAEVEAGDVIVHVERNHSMPGRRTGQMNLSGRAGTVRYARVSIRAGLPPSRFIASLAHELQHVSEVIAHPDVDDDASLEDLYRRIGHDYRVRGRTAFETDEASRIGSEVLRELATPGVHTRNTSTAVR